MFRSSALIFTLSLFAVACSKKPGAVVNAGPASANLDPQTPVAEVGGVKIVASELDESIKDQLKKAETDYQKQLYESRRQGLEQLIFKRLVGDEAKKKGVDEDTFLKNEIEAQVPAVADADAKSFFDKNPDKMGGQAFDAMKPRIVEYLTNQKRSQAARQYFDNLKQKAGVKILLTEPEEPRVNVAATGPSKGPEKAAVTIIEFSDFQCPYCSRAKNTVDEVMAAYPGKLRLVYRSYPLPFHDHAQKAAEAGECANEQGKFWQLHDYMFGHQDQLDVASLKKAARDNGIDGGKFDSCLDSGKFAKLVEDNVKAGQDVGVQGTPHFFINGRQLSGAQPFEKFKEIIDAELAAGKGA